MSYCRFSEGDVYLFRSNRGHWECNMCLLQSNNSKIMEKLDEVINHIKKHRKENHLFPYSRVMNRLQREKNEQQ